jgi:hypothetical protein
MDNKQMLISIYQNCSTGMQSINDLVKKTKDKTFIELLSAQYSRYQELAKKAKALASEEDIALKDNNWLEKAKMWMSVQMSTFTNRSTRHLAELMLVGTVMGTLTCYKTKSDQQKAKQATKDLLAELEKLEENNFNELKKYLSEF